MNSPTHLDGAGLRGALLMANEYAQRYRAELNRINVFPVPDGDTGTNLALTVSAIADRLRGNRDDSVAAVAREAAEAGIMGARGNCGMILSHFLLGLSDAIGDRVRLSVSEFGAALRAATEHVYRALEKPVEGTMITVMRAVSDEAERLQHSDFVVLFERLLVRARESLASTPDLLPALKASGVVDAGAKGFVHLLEGISSFLSGDPLVALEDLPEYDAEPMFAGAAGVEYPTEAETYRFCTEALVRGPSMPEADAVRAVLREKGDSLVVIRSGALLKVHIHTDEPEQVFSYLRTLGELATHKAEDMQVQHATVAAGGHMTLARRPVSIVSDSACDLPDEVVRAHGIHLVPLNLVYQDGRVLRDRLDITAEEFVVKLKAGEHPGTSQPVPGAFMEAFRRASEEGEAVLAILLSSALSGTYASAQAAAKQRGDGAAIHLFDSKGGSLLQGFLTLKASELGELGWEPARIIAELERVRKQSGFFISLDTFERALASGRIGRGRAWLGSLLDIKPILDVDQTGKLAPIDRVRGRKQVLPKMLEILEQRVPKGVKKVRFGVMHIGAPEAVAEVVPEIRARWGKDVEILQAPGTPVFGTHAGEGAWGIGYMIED
jgi:uncharacterized protein